MKKSLLLAALLAFTCFSVSTFSYNGEDSDSVVSSSALKKSADIDARLFLLKKKYDERVAILDGSNISDMEGKIISSMMILIESKMIEVDKALGSFETQESLVNLDYKKLDQDLKLISSLISEL